MIYLVIGLCVVSVIGCVLAMFWKPIKDGVDRIVDEIVIDEDEDIEIAYEPPKDPHVLSVDLLYDAFSPMTKAKIVQFLKDNGAYAGMSGKNKEELIEKAVSFVIEFEGLDAEIIGLDKIL